MNTSCNLQEVFFCGVRRKQAAEGIGSLQEGGSFENRGARL